MGRLGPVLGRDGTSPEARDPCALEIPPNNIGPLSVELHPRLKSLDAIPGDELQRYSTSAAGLKAICSQPPHGQ